LGILGADGDNGIGVAGMGWNIKLLALTPSFGLINLSADITKAVDQGAKVISLSLLSRHSRRLWN
jgi:hypothetical protein